MPTGEAPPPTEQGIEGGRRPSSCCRLPSREDAPIVDSSWDREDFDDEDDFAGEPDDECGMMPDADGFCCTLIGSEQCEFCPSRHLLHTDNDQSAGVCGPQPENDR